VRLRKKINARKVGGLTHLKPISDKMSGAKDKRLALDRLMADDVRCATANSTRARWSHSIPVFKTSSVTSHR
jgi:hypothetical protein